MFNQMTLSQTSVDFSWCYRVAIYERANIRQHVFLSLIKMNKPFGLVIELNISLVNCEYWRWRRDPHSIFVNLPTITPHIRKSTTTCSSTSLWIPVITIWVLCGVVFLAAQRCAYLIAYLTPLKLLQLFQRLSRSIWNLRISNLNLFWTFLITISFSILIALHLLLLGIHLLLQLFLFIILRQHFER